MIKFIHPITRTIYWFETTFMDWFKERDGYLDPCNEPAGVEPC